MNRVLSLSTLIFLASCSTTGQSPSQPYRAIGQSAPWSISSHYTKTPSKFSWSSDYEFSILIDGSVALSGTLSDSPVDLLGTYQGKRIEASCAKILTADNWSRNGQRESARCTVFIDNERAATLSLGS